MRLYKDATGVIVGTQAEARRMGKDWEQIDVPTDKQGLIDYLNARPSAMSDEQVRQSNTPEAQREAAIRMTPVDLAADVEEELEVAARIHEVGTAADGLPDHRPGCTSAQVAAGVLPRSDKVSDVTFLISKMNAPELGLVALEVIARGARLGGLTG